MTHSDIFSMRISPEDRRRLAELAESADRSESAVVRLLIRVATPVACGGITVTPAMQSTRLPETASAA